MIEPLEVRIALAFSQAALVALQAQLEDFAFQKTQYLATPKVPTLVTAKADDLVYAVYQVTRMPDFDDAMQARDVVETALTKVGLKGRSDKDKIAPRLVAAAIEGAQLTAGEDVAQVLFGALAANGTTKAALSPAGKAAVVGAGLKALSGQATPYGAPLALATLTQVTTLKTLTIFTTAAVKAAGTATGQLDSYIDGILEASVLTTEEARTAFALGIAKGVMAVPSAAGEVVGGRAAELTSDASIVQFAQTAMREAKLANAIAPISFATASRLTATTAEAFVSAVIGENGLGRKATTANRGLVAAGVIGAGTGTVSAIIDAALVGETLTKTELATFAGTASTSIGSLAGAVVAKVSALAETIAPGDATVREKIGIASMKAIATSRPSAAVTIAQSVIDSGGTLFNTDAARSDLAQALVKGAPNNPELAGFAVAGVASKLTAKTPQDLATFGAALIKTNTKAALPIARELAALLPGGTNFSDFAVLMAKDKNISTTTAPGVAAGVAVTSLNNLTISNGQITAGQSAGAIAAAVAQATEALKAKALTIAGTVALAVDVEHISDIAADIGALLQKSPATSKLPKLTSIGSLATSLAKAINTKPMIRTADRADELGELTAELTRQAIAVLGESATEADLAKTLSAVGTGVFKGLSTSLLINAGPFAADLFDASDDIAGGLAQTVSVAVLEGRLSAMTADNLIAADGVVEKALVKAAKNFAGDAKFAFSNVRGATGQTNRLYAFGSTQNDEPVSNANTGGSISGTAAYEIGSVIDPAGRLRGF